MSIRPKQTVGVIFGSRSGEHEVSVISAHQVMAALEVAGFSVLPIYITKQGHWYSGEPLNNIKAYKSQFNPGEIEGVYRVSLSPDPGCRQLVLHPDEKTGLFKKPPVLWADVFFPVMHGTLGEDGTLQGLLELADVPYVGCGVMASALSMDKVRTKRVCRDAGVPVLDWLDFNRFEWTNFRAEKIAAAEKVSAYPLIVKPVSLGSSIGVKRCKDRKELEEGIEAALVLDSQVMIEPALTNFFEVNCSVMGPPDQASTCEQPTPRTEVLTFEEKYKRGGGGKSKTGGSKTAPAAGAQSSGMASLDRIIPAPISPEFTNEVQSQAINVFRALGCAGLSRIDFLIDKSGGGEKLYFNELNPIPGSLAFYLWEPSGVAFDQLVTKLVDIAFAQHSVRKETLFSFDANLLG